MGGSFRAQMPFGGPVAAVPGRMPFSLGIVAGYNPLTAIPGLHGYFEARDAASMTLSGGLVSEWRCKVTGFATSQGTVPAQPTLVTPTPGNPRLRFDGVDDCLLGTNHPYPIGNTACEIWLLMAQGSLVADATQRYALGIGEGAAYQRTISRVVSSGVNRARTQIGNGTTTGSHTHPSVDFSAAHVIRQILTASEVTTLVDGVQVGPTAVVADVRNARFRFGAFVNTLAGNFLAGDIMACLVTPPLSAQQAPDLDNFLTARKAL